MLSKKMKGGKSKKMKGGKSKKICVKYKMVKDNGRSNKMKKSKKGSKKKRKLNPFFKLMLNAKKKGLKSFMYNGNEYVGTEHPRLGMIYKKK